MNTAQFMEATGLNRYTIKNWQERGYLVPDNGIAGQVGAGKGIPLTWSEREVAVAQVMRALVDAGLALAVAADAARGIGARKRATIDLTDEVSVTVRR